MKKPKERAPATLDPTPDTRTPLRGQTSAADRGAQTERAAAARRDRARPVKGNIPNAGNVGRGQRGVSGIARQPKRERPK